MQELFPRCAIVQFRGKKMYSVKNLLLQPLYVQCQIGMAETIGLGHLPFDILEQNMNIKSTEDNKKSLKYVLISCIPSSRTSFFFPYLLLLSIRYPSRYSSIDTHFTSLDAEAFAGISPSWCGANLKIVKKAADQSSRTLCNPKRTKSPLLIKLLAQMIVLHFKP